MPIFSDALSALRSGFSPQSELPALITILRGTDEDARRNALDKLYELARRPCSPDDALLAVKEAATPFPPGRYDTDVSAALLRVTNASPYPALIPVIERYFHAYSKDAANTALGLLLKINTEEAAQAYIQLLPAFVSAFNPTSILSGPMLIEGKHAHIIFPRLYALLDHRNLWWDTTGIALQYAEQGTLSPEHLAEGEQRFLKVYDTIYGPLASSQQDTPGQWQFEDSYVEPRAIAINVILFFGYSHGEAVLPVLRTALGISDPRIKLAAIISLVRRGEWIPDEVILAVARNPESRFYLYQEMDKLDRDDLCPEEYCTIDAFCEAQMVNWLCFPTELGCAPDEIELMDVVTKRHLDTGARVKYFVYRFRTYEPHFSAKDGWLAGIVGPVLEDPDDVPMSRSDTFSSFTPWDQLTAEGHVNAILGIVDDIS